LPFRVAKTLFLGEWLLFFFLSLFYPFFFSLKISTKVVRNILPIQYFFKKKYFFHFFQCSNIHKLLIINDL
jgi:hypothetical protein